MGTSWLLVMALVFETLMLALGWMLWGLEWKFVLLWAAGAVCITLLVAMDMISENPRGRLAMAVQRLLDRWP